MKFSEARPLYRDLPADLTISKGDEISGLEFLQHPRLASFYRDNPASFAYACNRDAAIYNGPDMVIP